MKVQVGKVSCQIVKGEILITKVARLNLELGCFTREVGVGRGGWLFE